MFSGLLIAGCSLPEKKPMELVWQTAQQLPVQKDSSAYLGFAGMVSGIQDNFLILAGGANFPGKMPWEGGIKHFSAAVTVFSFQNGHLVNCNSNTQLPGPVAYAASCTTPFGLLIAGGENESGILDQVSLLQYDSAGRKINCRLLPPLPLPLTNAMAVYFKGAVFILGGESRAGTSNSFFRLLLDTPDQHWETLPVLPRPVSHAIVQCISYKGRICFCVAGGRSRKNGEVSTISKSLDLYDPETHSWLKGQDLPYPLAASAAVLINGSQLLVIGGDKGVVFREVEKLILEASREKDSLAWKAIEFKKATLQANHPGFSGEILLYDAQNDHWSSLGNTPFNCPVTTTALHLGDLLLVPSGEIRPGVRSPLIQIAKISKVQNNEAK